MTNLKMIKTMLEQQKNHEIFSYINGLHLQIDHLHECIKIAQEVLNERPKIQKKKENYICPSCERIVHIFKDCPICSISEGDRP